MNFITISKTFAPSWDLFLDRYYRVGHSGAGIRGDLTRRTTSLRYIFFSLSSTGAPQVSGLSGKMPYLAKVVASVKTAKTVKLFVITQMLLRGNSREASNYLNPRNFSRLSTPNNYLKFLDLFARSLMRISSIIHSF